MDCRPDCAACCVAPSISSPLPGLPEGKPAGARCPSLREDLRCAVWGTAAYPAVCRSFKPAADVCGKNREQALRLLADMERATRPDA